MPRVKRITKRGHARYFAPGESWLGRSGKYAYSKSSGKRRRRKKRR